ncbi:hypothetical protein ISCGN_024849 [Ixodes scapularis]
MRAYRENGFSNLGSAQTTPHRVSHARPGARSRSDAADRERLHVGWFLLPTRMRRHLKQGETSRDYATPTQMLFEQINIIHIPLTSRKSSSSMAERILAAGWLSPQNSSDGGR